MPLYSRRTWEEEDVKWGVTGCSAPFCAEPADLLLDGEPFCVSCTDRIVDRWAAVAVYPPARWLLPDVFADDNPFSH